MSATLLTFGETMGLFHAADIGRVRTGAYFRVGIGGAEANVAVAATRLGAAAVWCGRLGDDALGSLVAATLRAEGVRTVITRDPAPTGVMVKYERFAGIVHVDYHRRSSAGAAIEPADVPDDLLAESSLVHVTGITAALSVSARETVMDVVDRAVRRGLTVSFDVNFRSKLWSAEEARPVLREIAERADIVFAGTDEARLLLNKELEPRHAASALADLSGVSEVVIKRGAEGCTALVDGRLLDAPAPDARVVDVVGAGDAFVGAYLTEKLAGSPPERCVETAVAVGALAVAVPGDSENLPSRAELASADAWDVQR